MSCVSAARVINKNSNKISQKLLIFEVCAIKQTLPFRNNMLDSHDEQTITVFDGLFLRRKKRNELEISTQYRRWLQVYRN